MPSMKCAKVLIAENYVMKFMLLLKGDLRHGGALYWPAVYCLNILNILNL